MNLFSKLHLEAVEDFFLLSKFDTGDNHELALAKQIQQKLSKLEELVVQQRVTDLRVCSNFSCYVVNNVGHVSHY